jgi:phage gp36-like protein
MMTIRIESILAVRKVAPHRICQEFVLRLARPIAVLRRPCGVFANYLLQKDDVGINRSERLAKAVQNELSVVPGKAFVNIDGNQA